MIPAWARELIARESAAFLAGDRKLLSNAPIVAAVAKWNAWPVYADVGGTLFLDSEGQVLLLTDDSAEPGIETDPHWQTLAWVCAAERLPELRPLLPKRPLNAKNCDFCSGQGRVALAPENNLRCAQCSGLGWIQEHENSRP